jgi:hypothetical protein
MGNMKLWKSVKAHVTPMRENAYRPHLLRRASLVFFLALTLAVEGFLAASLVARQSDTTFLSAAQAGVEMQQAVAGSTPIASMIAKSANWILGGVALLLVVAVVLTFFLHIDVQSHEMLAGGLIVAAIALTCLMANTSILGAHAPEQASPLPALAGSGQ